MRHDNGQTPERSPHGRVPAALIVAAIIMLTLLAWIALDGPRDDTV